LSLTPDFVPFYSPTFSPGSRTAGEHFPSPFSFSRVARSPVLKPPPMTTGVDLIFLFRNPPTSFSFLAHPRASSSHPRSTVFKPTLFFFPFGVGPFFFLYPPAPPMSTASWPLGSRHNGFSKIIRVSSSKRFPANTPHISLLPTHPLIFFPRINGSTKENCTLSLPPF